MKPKLFSSIASIFVLAALVVLLPSASRAVAQRPAPAEGTISYSGRLSNDASQPVADGMYAFSFALYDAANGGNLLWSETQTGVAVKDGAFTALLGSATPLPTEARISRGWLAVGVRGPGETDFTALAPRQPMNTAAPASPSSPTVDAACAHTHFGEKWTGNSNGTTGQAGLFVQDNATDGIGIQGFANHGSGWGVNGESTNGFGVRGYSYTGFAMAADGNAAQARDRGGWVKAMARVSGTDITRCYNSQASGASISTPPCGFTSSGFAGNYTVDFGFQVDDRFISITPEWGNTPPVTSQIWSFPTANQVYVWLSQNSAFFIIVY
jgi:hypothetical protein